MRSFKILALTALTSLSVFAGSTAKAGLLLEPYLGYELGKLEHTTATVNYDLSSAALGLRLGVTFPVVFIAADYSFGHGLQAETARVLQAGGGRVVGQSVFAFPDTTDFAAHLLAARHSGANVIGLACTGAHLENAVKQAAEFGLVAGGQRLASLLCLITSVDALGLDAAQGLLLTSPFYWDLNPATRAFSARFRARFGQPPTMVQAGAYSATRHYLRAIAAGADPMDGAATIARMRDVPPEDDAFGPGIIRRSGSVIHDMHLFQVKRPGESLGRWDYYDLRRTTGAEAAFGPERACTW